MLLHPKQKEIVQCKDNFIVNDSAWVHADIESIFGNHNQIETVEFISDKNIEDLAVRLNAYKSKSQAKQAGRIGSIPKGYTEFWIS